MEEKIGNVKKYTAVFPSLYSTAIKPDFNIKGKRKSLITSIVSISFSVS